MVKMAETELFNYGNTSTFYTRVQDKNIEWIAVNLSVFNAWPEAYRQSLLAGKLHAILTLRYTKGRDVYDLLWYLADPTWPEPNLIFLNNALRQTHWTGPEVTKGNWAYLLVDRLDTVDWSKVVDDVRPFIERESDLVLLTKENVVKLIKSR